MLQVTLSEVLSQINHKKNRNFLNRQSVLTPSGVYGLSFSRGYVSVLFTCWSEVEGDPDMGASADLATPVIFRGGLAAFSYFALDL